MKGNLFIAVIILLCLLGAYMEYSRQSQIAEANDEWLACYVNAQLEFPRIDMPTEHETAVAECAKFLK